MKTDITRKTFDPFDHYNGVRKQQGRVDIDADWNEQIDIQQYQDRATRKDVIGRASGPEGNAGYAITSPDGQTISIGAGRYYVDGILVENDALIDYAAQPDLPNVVLPTEPDRYLFYLDVWERAITALEDPSIREVALGGPDHGTRTKVLGQVKWERAEVGDACNAFGEDWAKNKAGTKVRLQARSTPGELPANPCEVPASAGYRRLGNQLYRVEIWKAGALGTAQFTWSRENGSVVTGCLLGQSGTTLNVISKGRDENLGFKNNDWVELNDDARELQGKRGVLVQLVGVTDSTFTFDGNVARIIFPEDLAAVTPVITADQLRAQFGDKATIRRWESNGTTALFDTQVPLDGDVYQPLESGVEVRFSVDAPENAEPTDDFRVGDYWMIPARTNTGDVEWPTDGSTPRALPPQGIEHHYARLALATLTGDAWAVDSPDCRCIFPPLCDLPKDEDCCCCEITVGDGKTSHGDFDDLQAAVNAISRRDKDSNAQAHHHICLLPGIHFVSKGPVVLKQLKVKLSGCGVRSPIINPENGAVIFAEECEIEIAEVHALGGGTDGTITLQHCLNSYLHDSAFVNIAVSDVSNDLTFSALQDLNNLDKYGSNGPALVINEGRDHRVERNFLHGNKAINFTGPEVLVKGNTLTATGMLFKQTGLGEILIMENDIRAGEGHGISYENGTYEKGSEMHLTGGAIVIQGNRIDRMSGNGIMAQVPGKAESPVIPVIRVEITGNVIKACCHDVKDLCGGIIWESGENVLIARNRVVDCGGEANPVVGILVRRTSGATITENVVEGNGASDPMGEPGRFQAGIAALHVLPGKAYSKTGKNAPSPTHALKVHGNTVSTPSGPALWALGMGPMSIADNTLVSQGVYKQAYGEGVIPVEGTVWDLAQRGSVISVLNIGLATEFSASNEIVDYMKTIDGRLDPQGFDRIPSGGIQCTDNQVYFSCEDNEVKNTSNTFLVSLDDVRLQDNTIRCDSSAPIDVANRVYALTAGIGGNRFQERAGKVSASLLALAGWLNMTDNIATHCLIGLAPPNQSKSQGNLIMLSDLKDCGVLNGKKATGQDGLFRWLANLPKRTTVTSGELSYFLKAISEV